MGDLRTVGVVVHHKQLKILDVAHSELVESVGKHVLGAGVRAVTNVGHEGGTAEATSAAAINTLGLSPVLLGDKGPNAPIPTFILLNLSAWKRGNEVVLFFTIFTLRAGHMTKASGETSSEGRMGAIDFAPLPYLIEVHRILHWFRIMAREQCGGPNNSDAQLLCIRFASSHTQ